VNEFSDPTAIATVDEFRAALLAVRDQFTRERPFSESNELKLLLEHYAGAQHTITTTELAKRVGFSSYSVANMRYGLFASRVAAVLGYTPGPFKNVPASDPHWWRTLAFGNDGAPLTKDGRYEWIMRPDLCGALRKMGWVKA
jgi:hypothetical protein